MFCFLSTVRISFFTSGIERGAVLLTIITVISYDISSNIGTWTGLWFMVCWVVAAMLFTSLSRQWLKPNHGQLFNISCRQKIELCVFGPSAIKSRCPVYLPACPGCVGKNLSSVINYCGKYARYFRWCQRVPKNTMQSNEISSFLA